MTIWKLRVNNLEHTFILTIMNTENGEWQGHVSGHNDQIAEFRSVLELLKLVEHKLEETK